MTAALEDDGQGRLAAAGTDSLLQQLRWATVAAVGPGLGRSADLEALIPSLLESTELPLVLDADGLNNVAGHVESLRKHRGPLVLTPHPGEFARLAGTDISTVQSARREHAVHFAMENHVVVVLKGHATVVSDGRRVYLNNTGNPGMATGGTGDVLAGLTAALLAQGLETFAAAQLAVYLHGLAGDLARDELGETSLIASDLLDFLPRAILAHTRGKPPL
jgi:NAD(P)H-hydrate epimerase